MKIIITGGTGFVGGAVIERCIADSAITQILLLTRRPLTDSKLADDPKVETILHEDWLNYSVELLEKLQGFEACLWCIGGRHTQTSRWPTHAEYVKVSVDYTLSAAHAFASSIAPKLPSNAKFRFVLCSGHASEIDQSKNIWIMGTTRKVKGQTEKGLFDIADASNGRFEAYTARVCGIYPKKLGVMSFILTRFVLPTLHVEELAATMVEAGKSGNAGRIIEHDEIHKLGSSLL